MARSDISRRLAMAGIAAASAVPAWAQTRAKPRALALVGDRYHNPDYIRVSLDKVFHELDIAIDYTMDYASLSAALLKPYQLLLILRDGMIWPGGYSGPDAYTHYETNLENAEDFPPAKPVTWIREEQGLAVKNFVEAGGGFYVCDEGVQSEACVPILDDARQVVGIVDAEAKPTGFFNAQRLAVIAALALVALAVLP